MTGDGGGEDKKYFSMYIESSVKNKTILHHRCKIVLLHVDFLFLRMLHEAESVLQAIGKDCFNTTALHIWLGFK